VVLDHVAQLAGLVEVAPAAFDADGFGNGDLHVGDVILVPLGFEQAVGETQGDQVLHRVLAQVMVDAIGAVFREEARHRVVHFAGRLQVVADGLFQHYAGALGQARLGQPGADRTVDRCRRGKEGDDAIRVAGLVRQRGKILGAAEIHAQVVQARHEALQHGFIEVAFADVAAQMFFDQRQMACRLAALASQREQARFGWQQTGAIELIERGKQLAQGQITEGAEQRQGAGFDR
jgi:hypothetical protein